MQRLLALVALAAVLLGAPGATASDGAAEWRASYDQQRAAIGDQDGRGHYDLALWLLDRHDDSLHDASALQATIAELESAIETEPGMPHAKSLLEAVTVRRDAHVKKVEPDYWAMAFAVIGGLGIFLLGMKNLSEGMQAVAGHRMRRMISAVTENRVLGVGTGTFVTMLVQSSSITTVIVVGFVNSGLMMLHQAIAVVMGANIGTTITGWILVLKIGKYGLPIIGVAAIAYLFARTDRWRYIAMAILGLGMVFFGLELMKNGFKPVRYVPEFRDAFLWFDAGTYFGVLKCAAVGCILTFLVQSSSATLGITMGLASQGVIPFETAAALVLGENVGTTITAWLASLGATTNAKRAAYAHVLFNLIGVFWITAIFSWYVQLVGAVVAYAEGISPLGLTMGAGIGSDAYASIVTEGIAITHTGFNVVNVLLFLPFVRIFARFLERMVPSQGEETGHLTPIDARLIDSPMLGIEQARGEVLKMAATVKTMQECTRRVLEQTRPDDTLVKEVFERERSMDNVQLEVIDFVTNLMTGEVPHAVADEARQMLRLADEYESISDYVSAVLKGHLKLESPQGDGRLTAEEGSDLLRLHDAVDRFVSDVSAGVRDNRETLDQARVDGEEITRLFKELREAHLLKATSPGRGNAEHTMAYGSMLNAYRKIKDHAMNIAEAVSTNRHSAHGGTAG